MNAAAENGLAPLPFEAPAPLFAAGAGFAAIKL